MARKVELLPGREPPNARARLSSAGRSALRSGSRRSRRTSTPRARLIVAPNMSRSPLSPLAAFLALALVSPAARAQVATTPADFHQPGTQPGGLHGSLFSVSACEGCHGVFPEDQEPFERWSGSMMANPMRDPGSPPAL